MNKYKIFGWIMILSFFVFGVLSVNAQKAVSESRKNWEITVTNLLSAREGYSFMLNSRGTLDKVQNEDDGITMTLTEVTLKEADVQEIGELIRNLKLTNTTYETVKGKGGNNFPYWSFSIEIGGKNYDIEGEKFSDLQIRVLNNDQKAVVKKLKAKLSEIGVVFSKYFYIDSANSGDITWQIWNTRRTGD